MRSVVRKRQWDFVQWPKNKQTNDKHKQHIRLDDVVCVNGMCLRSVDLYSAVQVERAITVQYCVERGQ